MKFLIISKMKDVASTIPPAVMVPLLEAAAAWIEQQKKAGTLVEINAITGWGHNMSICEHKSPEEFMQVLNTMPIGALMDMEIYPLADFNISIKSAIEAMKAAEKMMPGPPR